MKAILSAALVLGVCGLTSRAEDKSDPADKAKSTTPARELTELIQRIDKEQKEFNEAYNAAKTDDERKKVGVNPDSYAPDFYLKFMKKYANDPQAVRCFVLPQSELEFSLRSG